jgi:hypothetical protein
VRSVSVPDMANTAASPAADAPYLEGVRVLDFTQ